jgi:hypothetical protein
MSADGTLSFDILGDSSNLQAEIAKAGKAVDETTKKFSFYEQAMQSSAAKAYEANKAQAASMQAVGRDVQNVTAELTKAEIANARLAQSAGTIARLGVHYAGVSSEVKNITTLASNLAPILENPVGAAVAFGVALGGAAYYLHQLSKGYENPKKSQEDILKDAKQLTQEYGALKGSLEKGLTEPIAAALANMEKFVGIAEKQRAGAAIVEGGSDTLASAQEKLNLAVINAQKAAGLAVVQDETAAKLKALEADKESAKVKGEAAMQSARNEEQRAKASLDALKSDKAGIESERERLTAIKAGHEAKITDARTKSGLVGGLSDQEAQLREYEKLRTAQQRGELKDNGMIDRFDTLRRQAPGLKAAVKSGDVTYEEAKKSDSPEIRAAVASAEAALASRKALAQVQAELDKLAEKSKDLAPAIKAAQSKLEAAGLGIKTTDLNNRATEDTLTGQSTQVKAAQERKDKEEADRKALEAQRTANEAAIKAEQERRKQGAQEIKAMELASLEAQAAGHRKVSAEIEKQLRFKRAYEQAKAPGNVSDADATTLAKRKISAEDAIARRASGKTFGYTEAQQLASPYNDPFRGLNAMAKPGSRMASPTFAGLDAFAELQKKPTLGFGPANKPKGADAVANEMAATKKKQEAAQGGGIQGVQNAVNALKEEVSGIKQAIISAKSA